MVDKNKVTNEVTNFFSTCYKQQASNANFSKLSNVMGFKPTANKVLNTVMMKKLNTWQKVEVVSSVTALETLYMGGSSNIDGVIVNMCTKYIGSNNLPLLDSKGDFGARLDKSAAASRYIFTRASQNFDDMFNSIDLHVLPRYNFEGQDIEYKFLTFNLPMLLINGSEGMGSGHAQKILPRSVESVKKYIQDKLRGELSPNAGETLVPDFGGFTGTVDKGNKINQWIVGGKFKTLSSTTLEIHEVPVSETYKSYIKKLDALVDKGVITSYVDLCDPKTDKFKFTVKHRINHRPTLNQLKLITTETENFTVIDENNSVKVHSSPTDIIEHYYRVKMKYLALRKDYIIESTTREIQVDLSKYNFICAIFDNRLIINNRKKTEIIKSIDTIEGVFKHNGSFEYLLLMPMYSLTKEKLTQLTKSIKIHKTKLTRITKTSLEQMWLDDLNC